MSTMFERAITGPMNRILTKHKYRKVGQIEGDKNLLRDTEPQILDTDDNLDVNAVDQGQNMDTVDEHPAAADVPATATLLGDSAPISHDEAAPADAKGKRSKSKSLLSCLHLSNKADGAAGGLPTAFNNRQSILKRLGKSAKKATPAAAPARPARPPKKSPYVLHAAAWRTNINELQTQLAAGSEVSKRDKAGLTALHYAAWQGSVDAVQILLDAGADVNVRDPEGMLPIHFAAWFNRLDVAALLLDKGSQINPPSKGLMWPTTPLIYASKMGHAEMVSLLMDRGAQVAATYKAASSALHEAAWAGHTEVVAEMMRRDVSHDVAAGKSKYRPLHLAAMNGNASVVEELLSRGAWVDARSQLGRTPLHLACEKGHVAVAAALVSGGADLLAKDRHGYTPLHLAVDNNHVQLAKLLLDKGATPDAADQRGGLALNYAHDPDFYKLLRAVRWYGAASVPSGNNPTSSRYVSTTPAAPAAETATPAAATADITSAAEPTAAAAGTDEATPEADLAAEAALEAATSDMAAEKRSNRAQKKKANRQSPGAWLKAHMPHMPHIRSHKSAVAAAAAQPGSSALETPEQADGGAEAAEGVPSLSATIAAVQQALTGRVSPGGRTSPFAGRVSPDSAAAQAAAVDMARAAVQAVVARAAAEAALEEVANEQKVRSKSASPDRAGANGGFVSPERDSVDDARLLQQIRSALAAGTTSALPEPVAAAAAAAAGAVNAAESAEIEVANDDDVALEDYMRPPASISIDGPSGKVSPDDAGTLASPGDVQVRSSISDQAAKHTIPQGTPTASALANLPVSTKAAPGLLSDTSAFAGTDTLDDITAPRSPPGSKPGLISSTAKPGGKGGSRYAAPTVSAAAKKASKTSKRKAHKSPGGFAGAKTVSHVA